MQKSDGKTGKLVIAVRMLAAPDTDDKSAQVVRIMKELVVVDTQ